MRNTLINFKANDTCQKVSLKKIMKNSEVFHVKNKPNPNQNKNTVLELEQTLSCSCVHLV